jgi:hypothetical protein
MDWWWDEISGCVLMGVDGIELSGALKNRG